MAVVRHDSTRSEARVLFALAQRETRLALGLQAELAMDDAESQGWGRELEILASDVIAAFLRDFKSGRERCWIAEVDGVMQARFY